MIYQGGEKYHKWRSSIGAMNWMIQILYYGSNSIPIELHLFVAWKYFIYIYYVLSGYVIGRKVQQQLMWYSYVTIYNLPQSLCSCCVHHSYY